MDHARRTTHISEAGLEAISGELFGREPWLLVGDALILVHDRQTGRVVDCNESALDLLKVPLGDGDPLQLDHLVAAGAPHDLAAFAEHLERTRSHGFHRFAWQTCATDGSPVFLDLSTQLVAIEGVSRIVSVGRDVTDQVLTRRALERAEAFLNTAIEGSPAGIILVRQGETEEVKVNPAGLAILGHPPDMQPPDRAWLTASSRTYHLRDAEGRPLEGEEEPVQRALRDRVMVRNETVRLRDANGAERWLLTNAAPVFGPHDETLGAIGVFTDLTELKEQELERRRLSEQLVRSQRLEALSLMAAGVAHEINNPLMAILNYSDLVELQATDPDQVRSHAAKIAKLCGRIAGIVQDLATFANAERSARAELDLVPIIDSITLMLGPRARQAQVQICVDIEATELVCQGNETQLRQVLVNLVQNAITAMEGNGASRERTLTIRCRRRTSPRGDELECSVRDTGSGMSPDVAARAFHPFFTTRRGGVNTGLGLSVSHSIIEDHGGTLAFDTAEGLGSEFYFTLPASSAGAARGRADAQESEP